jgi:hypothetical protein
MADACKVFYLPTGALFIPVVEVSLTVNGETEQKVSLTFGPSISVRT